MIQYCVKISPQSITNVSPEITNDGGVWPAKLVSLPFRYKHNNITYNLNEAGIYKFSVPSQNTTNILIHDGDIKKLLANLTYFITPGQLDTNKTVDQLQSKAYSARVNILCEKSVDFIQSQLTKLNIISRKVRVVRADDPNNFYDGHVMLEVFFDDGWHLFDAQLGISFNNWSALKDVAPCSENTTFNFANKYKLFNSSEPMQNNIYHHCSTIDMFLFDENSTKLFQKDIMQIGGIDYQGLTYFSTPQKYSHRTTWLLSLSSSYRVVNNEQFISTFYN